MEKIEDFKRKLKDALKEFESDPVDCEFSDLFSFSDWFDFFKYELTKKGYFENKNNKNSI